MVAKELMKSRNPRERLAGRQLSRAKVANGSALDLAIKVSAAVMKENGGGGAGPATGSPMVGTDVSTPTAGSGRFRRSKSSKYDVNNG